MFTEMFCIFEIVKLRKKILASKLSNQCSKFVTQNKNKNNKLSSAVAHSREIYRNN